MAAAATATETDRRTSSYTGSLISITSKSEIRYQGLLFHIDPLSSTIALRNVRSYGTEGRKDGANVPASETVYEYIYFRGTDIKDLKVLSSPPVQSISSIYDDPAIIQSSHLPSAPAPTSLPPMATMSATSFVSNSLMGQPSSTANGSLNWYQYGHNNGSWGSSLPVNMNDNENAFPLYWQRLNGMSGGVSSLQQPPLPQPPLGLAAPTGQQTPLNLAALPLPSQTPLGLAGPPSGQQTLFGLTGPPSGQQTSFGFPIPHSGQQTAYAGQQTPLGMWALPSRLLPSSLETHPGPHESLAATPREQTFIHSAAPPPGQQIPFGLAGPPSAQQAPLDTGAAPSRLVAFSLETPHPGQQATIGSAASPGKQPLIGSALAISHGEKTPRGPVSPSGQKQIQHPIINGAMSVGLGKLPESPHPMLQHSSNGLKGSLSSLFTKIESPLPKASQPLGASVAPAPEAVAPAPEGSLNRMENNKPAHETGSETSSLPLASTATSSGLDFSSFLNQIVNPPKTVHNLTSSDQSIATDRSQTLKDSLIVTPNKHLQSVLKLSCSNSLQSTHKDIEVVQASRSEQLSMDSKSSASNLPIIASDAVKCKQRRTNMPHGTASPPDSTVRNSSQGREHRINKYTSQTRYSERTQLRGQGNSLSEATSGSHLSNKAHGRVVRYRVNEPGLRSRYVSRGHSNGIPRKVTHVTKFTEDFDFVAMNEKFNKEEIWGQLGKSNKSKSDRDCLSKDSYDLSTLETKPVYDKDDFFDSLSYNLRNQEARKLERTKYSERKKMDMETFGEFQITRGIYRGRGVSRGGRGGGPQFGRCNGRAGRGQGLATWSRVT